MIPADERRLRDGGTGASAYGDAVAMYLALGVGRSANYWSALTPWGGDFIVQTFGRQAIPMVWDHAEGNPFSSSPGNWSALGADVIRLRKAGLAPVAPPAGAVPGQVLAAGADGIDICTGTGVLRVVRLQKAGARVLEAADFLRGFEVRPGMIFMPLVGSAQ